MTWVLRILIPKPGVADTGAGLGGARFVLFQDDLAQRRRDVRELLSALLLLRASRIPSSLTLPPDDKVP